ncbi:unnamed protein product [Dracunculus medinensis]|uniref:ShKT domain-containing protein n=1 Tax=Dracunculus medinensis TaxID=318479 RepID=A0A0N4U2S0_DRAME|nr:unnamed protein product [Dracunculus medinensis]
MVTVTDESGQSVERSRPLIPTSRCEDNEPELCGSLFKIPPEVAADNLDDYFLNRKNPLHSITCELLAIQRCLCINIQQLTKCSEFIVYYLLTARIPHVDSEEKCQAIFNAQLCNYSFMAKEALARCPYTCGLCDKDGAGGNCVDLALDCAILMNVMGCDYSHLRTNCKKTCEIDTCITRTTTNTVGGTITSRSR